MKVFNYKGKKYKWIPTGWQKAMLTAILGAAVVTAIYIGWIYEQVATSGNPWIG